MHMLQFVSIVLATVITTLAGDPHAHLNKSSLYRQMAYVEPALKSCLPQTRFTLKQWQTGTIPQSCKDLATNGWNTPESDPHDFQIFNVTYSDCDIPWVFCHHKDSNATIQSIATQFGRVPIQMRQYIRYVRDVPDSNGWAYESGGDITFMRPVDNMLNAIIHEIGHSIDSYGYSVKGLSSTDDWLDAIDSDSKVPTDYSETNAIENMAENTVIAVLNENYPGGFPTFEPGSESILGQYTFLADEAISVGKGNSMFKPGQKGSCVHHIAADKIVSMDIDDSKPSTKRNSPIQDRAKRPRPACNLAW